VPKPVGLNHRWPTEDYHDAQGICHARHSAGLARLRAEAEVVVWPDELPPPYAALCEQVKGSAGLLCLLTDRVDAALLDAASPGLRVVSQMAVGYDNIDVAAATTQRIPVGNTPGVLTDATADFAWALLMAAARRVAEGDRFVRAGRWRTWGPTLLLGPEVTGATLGIVGFGRIGQAVARRARGFEMRLLYCSRSRQPDLETELGVQFAEFDDLLREADFITLHTPLTPETRHLFGRPQFERMKRSAVLVNTARGGVVDPDALYHALRNGLIASAALDVTEPEPILPDSPLLTLDNLVIAPHIASAGVQTRDKMATMAAENLLAGLRGKRLPYCVNPAVYETPA
jgi:glyoxylate reductase